MPEFDPLPEPPLERILSLAAAGDEEAWRRLVDAYGRRVYGLLVHQCGDRDLAEELTQATFVKLATTLGTGEGGGRYEERGRFEAWLFRIAINALRDEMRRRQRQARTVDLTAPAPNDEVDPMQAVTYEAMARQAAQRDDDPAQRLSRAEQVLCLKQAVAELNEAEQRVLHLRHTAGLSFTQIAQTLGEPLGTVLARGHRALGKLRKMMEHMQGTEDKV